MNTFKWTFFLVLAPTLLCYVSLIRWFNPLGVACAFGLVIGIVWLIVGIVAGFIGDPDNRDSQGIIFSTYKEEQAASGNGNLSDPE